MSRKLPDFITRDTIAMLRYAAGEYSVWSHDNEVDATSPYQMELLDLANAMESCLPDDAE